MSDTHQIPHRILGRTGERVSLIGLGGFHLGLAQSEAEAVRIVRTAIDAGVNFMDNSWDYHGGDSELRMGKALRDGYRKQVFLMTKFDGRTKEAAAEQIDESLQRLGVDAVDLLQFHEIIRPLDVERIFSEGGAIEAATDALLAGKTRYIGFTGHKHPAIHLKMLAAAAENDFTFDAVQMPLNLLDTHFLSFEKEVLPPLVDAGTGVLAMKPLAEGRLPLTGAVTATECLHYAMNLPVSVVITGCESLAVLEQALAAARSYHPLDEEQVRRLRAATVELAEGGVDEHYKTTDENDGTEHHRHWLGGADAAPIAERPPR